ncbi:MAG: lipid A deacylase LpxR family protein [Pseudomonadota bacterium]
MEHGQVERQKSYPSIRHLARSKALILVLFTMILNPAGQGVASEDAGPTLSLLFENDILATDDQDRNYSNGLQVEWVTRPGGGPGVFHKVGRFFSPDKANAETRSIYGAGHRFYTPDDLSLAVPDPNDRPYAAFLYGAVGVLTNTNDKQLDVLNLTAGVVGPAALGEDLQRTAHRTSGAIDPQGWDTQITNRFAFEAEWLRIYRFKLAEIGTGWSVEALPQYVVRAGNFKSELGIGGMLRVGKNIPIDFGVPRIEAGLAGAAYQKPVAKFGWYIFAGVNGRYVPRDLVLDEVSALGEGVTREPLVGDVELGLALNLEGVQVSYSHVWRSQSFEEEIGDSAVGVLSLTVNF